MKYCMNCGKQLPDDAKFCVSCGTPVQTETPPLPQKNVEKAGALHKCPNCGEVLDSMVAICPACGYEIRGVKAVSSVQRFADQLAKIESEEMPQTENNSVMKKVFGRDLRETPKRLEAARVEFEQKKRNKKVSLISNFPVPNTKEDLTEFALLVTSNLHDTSDILVYSAWFGKLEQLYQKAKKKTNRLKLLAVYIFGGTFVFALLLLGFAYKPTLTAVLLVIAVAAAIGYFVWSKRNDKRRK